MKQNRLVIQIKKPIPELFKFAITPPNSTLWIPGVVKEETNDFPVRIGTIYKLTNENGNVSEMAVVNIKENKIVEWISSDKNYHCRYTFISLDKNTSELQYFEWVNIGEIQEPFTQKVLDKLKSVVENQNS